uniref:Biotin carboxyl carrier protein of acetyl-CoA carboxylase n=1 Tax=Anthurium amnicola TaxID=1678845 RepID=A0A1D1ZLU5_9ARAE
MASAPVREASAAAASTAFSSNAQRCSHAKAVSFRLRSKLKLPLLSSKVSGFNSGDHRSRAPAAKSLLGEVGDGPPNDSVPTEQQKPKAPAPPKGDGAEPSLEEAAVAPMPTEAASQFLTQVASLVKLVDSRDIIELQLKQQECELIIRKKEALPQPPAPAPVIMMPPHPQPPVVQTQFAPPLPAALALASAVASAPPPTPAPTTKSAKSSLPPLKSPMAGTFYRNPGPGQPPFVKVGDKVNKGQVLCIIEAMKLMNEIEAEQAGTIVEILLEDGKPVSIDQPIFIIEP